MIFLRFLHHGRPAYGWSDGQRVGLLDGSPFEEFQRGALEVPLDSVALLAPCQPSKIVGVDPNYLVPDRAGVESDLPTVFLKPPSSVIGPGEPIRLPAQSERVEHEAELAAVIGRRVYRVAPEDALGYVLGYTIANDVTARDVQERDQQWSRAKAFDTFCPLGPWIVQDVDTADLMIHCRVNDDVRQVASTRDMRFTARQLIAFTSSIMTLEPGDVVLTGTPAGAGPLADGDQVVIEIEGVGSLRNPVQTDRARMA